MAKDDLLNTEKRNDKTDRLIINELAINLLKRNSFFASHCFASLSHLNGI